MIVDSPVIVDVHLNGNATVTIGAAFDGLCTHGGGQVHVHVNDQGGVNVNDHVEVNVDVGELPTQDTSTV